MPTCCYTFDNGDVCTQPVGHEAYDVPHLPDEAAPEFWEIQRKPKGW